MLTLILFLFVPCFLAVFVSLAWSWRSLFGVVAVIGGLLVMFWLDHSLDVAQPGLDAGSGPDLGIAMAYVATLAFVAMVAFRTTGLALQDRGWSRLQTLWLDGTAVAVTGAIVFLVVF